MKRMFKIFITWLLIFAMIAVPLNVNGDNWPQYGHDDLNTGCSSSSISDNLDKLWTFSVDGAPMSIIADNNTVYVGLRNYITEIGGPNLETKYDGINAVYALDLKNGTEKWMKKLEYDVYGLAIYQDKLIVSSKRHLLSMNKITGEIVWDTEIGTNLFPPFIHEKKVYVTSYDGQIYLINIENGEILWTFDTGDNFLSSLVVFDGKVIAGCKDGNVYGLNKDNGSKLWEFQTDDEVVSTPVINEDIVYIGSNDHHLYALNPNTGTLISNYSSDGNVYTPTLGYGKILFWTKIKSSKSSLVTLDIDTFSKSWEFTVNDWIDFQPTIADGKAIIGAENCLYIFNIENGDIITRKFLFDIVSTESIICEDKIITGTFGYEKGIIYAFGENESDKTQSTNDSQSLIFTFIVFISIILIAIIIVIIFYKKKRRSMSSEQKGKLRKDMD